MLFKVNEVNDIEGFARAVECCEGAVELRTEEKDVYNMKSRLSQLISLNVILSSAKEPKQVVLYVENPDDFRLYLKRYLSGQEL